MANALKWINREAKRLQKKSPGSSWANLTKAASANYRKTHKAKVSGAKKGKKPARRPVPIKNRKTVVSSSKQVTTVGNVFDLVPQIGAAPSVAQLESRIRKKLLVDIGKLEALKFSAKKKSTKRKIARRITAKKADYRRYS